MEKTLLENLKKKLEREKEILEKELEKFAQRDEKIEGNWKTKFPKWNGESGSSALETMADEVEEFLSELPIEHALELKLKNVNLALEKIKKREYGICEKCKKEIEIERLKAVPEARFCLKCKK
jgi:DnaK suppressor protein